MKEINIKGLDEIVYYGKCANGLDVYMWVNDKINSVFMSLSIKYGSIHTDFNVNNKRIKTPEGVAHFLEHIKFNEKDGTTAHDFFYKNGAEVNAFTTFEYTCYHVYAMDKIEENINHLLDFVQTPYFTQKMIAKEKGIIVEEEKMGEDDSNLVNYFGIFKNLFEKSNYRNLIIGNIENIKKITIEDVKNVFDSFYHPENMFLCITGNFNPHEMFEIVKQNQATKEFDIFKKSKITKIKEKEKVNEKYKEIKANIVAPKVKVGLKISKAKFKNLSDLEIRIFLSLILNINFGLTSEFNDFLLENNLVTSLSASGNIYDDYVIIVISFETRFKEEIIKLIKEKLKKLEVTEDEVKRKQKAQIAYLILNFEGVEKVNYIIQNNIITYNKIIDNIKEEYEKIDYVKLNKMIAYLKTNNISIFVMDPHENN